MNNSKTNQNEELFNLIDELVTEQQIQNNETISYMNKSIQFDIYISQEEINRKMVNTNE